MIFHSQAILGDDDDDDCEVIIFLGELRPKIGDQR